MMGTAQLALQPAKHESNLKMSAYVVVELTGKDATAKDRYSAAAGPVLKQFGVNRRPESMRRSGSSF
jgi:hypothetical protein